MLKIQHKKRELAAGAFGTKKASSETKINDIKILMDLQFDVTTKSHLSAI